MTSLEFILSIACAVLLLITIVTLISNKKLHKNVDTLVKSINNFIEKDVPTSFSTSDNHFAMLQNAVSDLENLYRLEQSNTQKASIKNTQFISDISHQLKTPLAGIRLYVEMENEQNPSEHTKKEVLLIEKMENLIYKLLRLEKIKSDSYAMELCIENINAICNNVVAEFKPLFPNKQYVVTGDSKMRVDKAWMFEAISNIVKNASEHTGDNGKIEIIIDDGEKSTIISVKDNGGGVSNEDLPHLFNRFHRTSNANPNSAGIGLAITKAIVEKHHGTISAENIGEGLSVVICLPHIDGCLTIQTQIYKSNSKSSLSDYMN